MKRLSTLLLTATIGVSGVTVGAAEVCGVDFKEVWAAKVKAIQQWNKSHASYVARHHLDNPALEANTRRMKERARKALEVMCAQADGIVGGIDSPVVGVLQYSEMDLPGSEGNGVVPLEEKPLTALIAKEDYPVYEATSRDSMVDGERGPYPGFPGWFGGGGYLGGTHAPSNPPVTPPVMVPTPEPSTLVLSAVPMLALCLLGRKKKGDL